MIWMMMLIGLIIRTFREAIKISGDPAIIDLLNSDLIVLEKFSPEIKRSVLEIRKRLY